MSKDPYFQREQEKYDNPVASREFLLQILDKAGEPLGLMDICQRADAQDEDSQIGVQRRLRAMEREGQIIFTRAKKYALADKLELVSGTIIGHRDGFGFLKLDEGGKDLFVPGGQMQKVLHGDRVLAQASGVDNRGRQEARIVRVVEPRQEPIVGRFYTEQGVGIVIPDDIRLNLEIIIPPEHIKGARQGHVVVVEISQRPNRRMSAIGKVTEVLGEHMAPGMEIQSALRQFDIPHTWPKSVLAQVKKIAADVPESAKQGRVDLRDLPLVTIDGEDARDFDDAVFCKKEDNGGWRLWVAIADVSYYVKHNTALDDEAVTRATSVYFPEQVIPMLPEVLSNGLCSLNPEVDRLCMVCEMVIDATGSLKEHKFYEAVMHSHARLTYTKVWNILQGDEALIERYKPMVGHLRALHELYLSLKQARSRRGGIEFETQENKFVFNAQRKIDHIIPVERNDAHKLIEECMILANVSAAEFLQQHKAEALYRIHEEPEGDRLSAFLAYLGEAGISHKIRDKVTPLDFATIMNKVRDRADHELIQTMLLRSMKQAVYSPENLGHFGLALEAYAHFTSPIRRYPDLVVHRAIKAVLDKQAGRKSKTGGYAYAADEVEELGEHCSMAERRADDATRDVADWLRCEFMQDHIGDSFDGVIASVTSFGLFVRISDFHIDGLVHVTALDNDYYHYDNVKQMLVGERSGNRYRLGDPIRIKVAAVNLDERGIDLIPEAKPGRTPGGKEVAIRKVSKAKSDRKSKAKGRNEGGKGSAGKGRRGSEKKAPGNKNGASRGKPKSSKSKQATR